MSLQDIKKEFHDQILEGMARTLWVLAFADWVEEINNLEEDDEVGLEADQQLPEGPGPSGPPMLMYGGDWYDVTPETPEAAYLAANALTSLIAKQEGFGLGDHKYPLAELFDMARHEDTGKPFEFEDSGEMLELAKEFGSAVAFQGVGTGVAWTDQPGRKWHPRLPNFECHYDGQDLTWHGGFQQARYQSGDEPTVTMHLGHTGYSTHEITYINENDQSWAKHSYILWFGQVGSTYLMVYANGLQDALDEAIDWLVENAPGHIVDDEVNEEFARLQKDREAELGRSLDWTTDNDEMSKIAEEAEVDTTSGGNAGNRINSDEWGIVAEDPSKIEVLRIAGLINNPAKCKHLCKQAPPISNPPRSDIDELAYTMFIRNTTTARMFRSLLEHGEMPQAEFMAEYHRRCERDDPTSKSSFANNFGRYTANDYGPTRWIGAPRMECPTGATEKWPWPKYPAGAITRKARLSMVIRQVSIPPAPDPKTGAPRLVRQQVWDAPTQRYTRTGQERRVYSARNMLHWVGPSMGAIMQGMSDSCCSRRTRRWNASC